MKRILSLVMVIFLLSACLCSCGKEEKTDYYMIGYEAVEAGKYEKALENFEKAAEKGDDQAAKAAKIVSSYLDAKEAYEVGDIEGAKKFLSEMPADYKYYALSDEADALKQKVYGHIPVDEEETDEAQDEEELSEDKSEENSSEETAGSPEKDEPENQEDSAPASAKANEFTPQQAMAYVSAKYGVQGDLGMGLEPSYTEDGEIYYEIVADIGKNGESNIKKLRIFSDGTIKEQT